MIDRHEIDKSKLTDVDFSLSRIKRSLSKLDDNPYLNLNPVIGRCLSMLYSLIIENANVDLIDYGIKSYLILQRANFIKHNKSGLDTDVIIDNQLFELKHVPEIYPDFYFDYFLFFSISMIIDQDMIQEKNIDFEDIRNNSQTFWQKAATFLHAIDNKSSGQIYALLEELISIAKLGTTELIDPNKIDIINDPEIALLLQTMWLPIFKLYDFAYRGKSKEFNEEMERYLLTKRSYIIEKELTDDQRYWVDFPLLGCCAYAVDQGIEITVDTEYAPRWVYERRFLS